MAGFAIFSTLGYLALSANVPLEEVAATSGPGLAFVVYPTALAALPLWAKFFTCCFFVMLLLLGIDSAFSILEAVATAVSDSFAISRQKATLIITFLGILLGYPFVTRAGLYWLDIIDHYLLSYMLPLNVIVMCLMVAFTFNLKGFCQDINQNAELKIGPKFRFLIRYFTPLVLSLILISSLMIDLKTRYSGYAIKDLIILGFGSIIVVLIGAWILTYFDRRSKKAEI